MLCDTGELEIPADVLASWQDIVDILAEMAGLPAALLMRARPPYIEVLVASDSAGNPYHPGDREVLAGSGLYCERVLQTQARLLVPDALADPAWRDNPDVKLTMISYLGFPLLLPNKKPFGTICVLDNRPNEYSPAIEKLMQKLCGLIEAHLGLIWLNEILGDRNRRLADYAQELQVFRGLIPICANCKSIQDERGAWHPLEHYLIQLSAAAFSHGICPTCARELYPEFASPAES